MEITAALDRAAQAATSAETRRARWTEAINLIDRFERENPGHLQSHQFQFQGAVLLWARGRLWAQQHELDPTDEEAQGRAVENLDVAIARLGSLLSSIP